MGAEVEVMPEYIYMVNVATLARWSALVFGIVVGIPLTAILVQSVANAFIKVPPKT
jgi:hypothetical protein